MNALQRQYGKSLLTINCEERLNPSIYYKTLKIISKRRTHYPSSDQFISNKISQIPYKNYFVRESNKQYNLKLKEIRNKPVKPKINSDFKDLTEKIKYSIERNKQLKTRALTLENKKYINRIKDQKPKLLRAKYLNEIFKENHDKYIASLLRNSRFRKKEDKRNSFRLPYVKSNIRYKNGSTAAKMHSKTEYNLDEGSSKDNSIEQKDHKYNEISHNQQGHIGEKQENN